MGLEDLTTFTEVDSASDITVTSAAATFATMAQQADSYVYRDFGSGYFGNFFIDFECEITFSESNGGGDNAQAMIAGVSDTIGNWGDHQTANDGILIDTYYDGSNLVTRLSDQQEDNSDTYSWGAVTTHAKHYFRFERNAATATLKIYSDADRQTLVDALSIICETGTKQYFYALASREAVGNTAEISGYTQNFDLDPIRPSLSDTIGVIESRQIALEFIGDVGTHFDSIGINESIEIAFDRLSISALQELIALTENINIALLHNAVISELAVITEDIRVALDIPLNWITLANQGLTAERYYFTLTGSADSIADIEIPISSFQARKRTGESTYLSVIVSDYETYSAAIAARSNGEMIVEMDYQYNGQTSIRQEILRADLETIDLYDGGKNRTISLVGHKTTTFANRTVTIENPTYKSTVNGRRTFRFAKCDPYLNPGDTLVVGDDSMTIDYIVYMVSSNGYKSMEVKET